MPLFEGANDELIPFRRLTGGADLYEKDIEDLLWANLDEFTGDTLFPVARQARLPFGGIPDVIAMDRSGRVVVFEVKRDIDRNQLAQCLEYAGWARATNLDELAGLYSHGEDAFWPAWQEFTDSDTPVVVNPIPRLVLIAREFQARTESAFEFLVASKVPVTLIRVVIYRDESERRFVDVEGDHEPTMTVGPASTGPLSHTRFEDRRMRVRDLVDHDILRAGDELIWIRPKSGDTHHATITGDGNIRLPDGTEVTTPSTAAAKVTGLGAYDGWHAWRLVRTDQLLNDLRHELAARQADGTAQT